MGSPFIGLLHHRQDHTVITCGAKPFTMMIIIIFNHHSFPVSQEPTRSNSILGICLWHGLEQHTGVIETICCISKLTVTEPSAQFADTVIMTCLFFLSCCCDNRLCRLAMCRIHRQRHLVDTAGKLIQQSEARRISGSNLALKHLWHLTKKHLTCTLGISKIHNSKMFPYVMKTVWFMVSWIQHFLDLINCSLFTMLLVSLDLPFHITHASDEGWTAA